MNLLSDVGANHPEYKFTVDVSNAYDEYIQESRFDTHCLDFQRAPHAKLRLIQRSFSPVDSGLSYNTLSLAASSHDPVMALGTDLTEAYNVPFSGVNNSRVAETDFWPYHVIYNQRTTLAFPADAVLLEEGDNLREVGKYFNWQSNTWDRTGYLAWTGEEPLKETSTYYAWRRKNIRLTIDTTTVSADLTLYYESSNKARVGVIEPLFGEFTFVLNNKIGGASSQGTNNHPWFDFDAVYDDGDVNLAVKIYQSIMIDGTFVDTTAPDTSFVVW